MTHLALIKGAQIKRVFPASLGRLDIPGKGQVSPPVEGWEGLGHRIAAVTPAEIPDGHRAVGAPSYALVDGVPVESYETEPDVPDLAAYADGVRLSRETGGIVVAGVPIATDDRSKVMILGARMRAEANPDLVEPWKADDGNCYELTAAQIIAISDAVGDHVSACFAAYFACLAKIAAGIITDAAGVDAEFA